MPYWVLGAISTQRYRLTSPITRCLASRAQKVLEASQHVIGLLSYQYRNPHYEDKMVFSISIMGIHILAKTVFISCIWHWALNPPPGRSLLWMGVLGIIVFYIFSLLAFAAFRANFEPNALPPLWCNTLYECTVSMIRYGLIGELFEVGYHTVLCRYNTFDIL